MTDGSVELVAGAVRPACIGSGRLVVIWTNPSASQEPASAAGLTVDSAITVADTAANVADSTGNNCLGKATSRLAPDLPAGFHDADFPAISGNMIDLLPHAAQDHDAWSRLIEAASHHLHLLLYIWRDDNIGRTLRDSLIEKPTQGVELRVLYDAVGSLALPGGFFDPLVANHGQMAKYMPIRLVSAAPTLNFSNHHKVIIADGRRAYTGGINIGDEYLDWQDDGITIHGRSSTSSRKSS